MGDLADWTAHPWPQLEPITTAEQYAHALHSFDTARMYGNQGEPGVGSALDELRRRSAVTFDKAKPNSWFAGYVTLRPDLAELWPLPAGLTLTLDSTRPFGDPYSEPDENCTEEELEQMVSALGPPTLNVRWDCGWRGLPEFKDCGVELCLNSVWTQQIAESLPGEFGVWISLGNRIASTTVGENWRRDCGLSLGEPQQGW
ncbi:hypothetical protein SAMN05216533_2785 [Streptomyces sp. Ag109_O5-10]|nr:hypothetical protein SAMN05216533_2785 [Streptomyces sp. Ag109_O5-10]